MKVSISKKVKISLLGSVAILLVFFVWWNIRGYKQEQIPAKIVKKMVAGEYPDYDNDPQWKWWRKQEARDRSWQWKVPISFYGKVVDYIDGTPIEGVEIKFQCSDTSGTSEYITHSDQNGGFSLLGVRGKGMTVRGIWKEGYRRASQGVEISFEYAAFFEQNFHIPDPNKPVVFKMRKLSGTAKGLIGRRATFGVVAHGEATPIVLSTASRGTPGDILISMTRGARNADYRFDWTITIEGNNGTGLIESDEEFMFEAPEKGYQTRYYYEIKATDPFPLQPKKKNYYIRSGDGKIYARIEAEFSPARNDDLMGAEVSFYINPTGSRNLESRDTRNRNYLLPQRKLSPLP